MKKSDKNICANCGEEFVAVNSRQKYCKKSCKTRAYEQRKGLDAPEFLTNGDFEVVKKEEIIMVDNPEISSMQKTVKEFNLEINNNQSRISELKTKLDTLQLNKKILGGLAGGVLGYGISDQYNMDNKVAVALTGVAFGTLVAHVFDDTQEQKLIKARPLINEINSIRLKINNLKTKKLSTELKLNQEPKQLRETRIKELKVPLRKSNEIQKPRNTDITTAADLLNVTFDLMKAEGRVGRFLGAISRNAFITTFGQPGSGKSTFFLQMADHFTNYGTVLYVTPEEGLSPTFRQKLIFNNITTDKIHIVPYTTLKEIEKILKKYDYSFCFIDSINMMSDADAGLFEKLRNKFPSVLFAIIMQSTKDGKFKGSNEYAHNSDINIKIIAGGMAETIKNRFNELKTYEVFEGKAQL